MSSGNIPCGIAIPQTFAASPIDLRLIREFLPRAEGLGYDSLWVQEQIITGYGILEPVTLLTYASALTSRVRLGSSVLLPVIRNPLQLAKSLATLDQLSQGRLTVGIGIGGPHVPEAAFGVSPDRRGRRFVESIEVMKALWTQPRATFSGEFWRFEKLPMEPKPVQKPHPPLWFGAREPVALRRAVATGGWARDRHRRPISSSSMKSCGAHWTSRGATRRRLRYPSVYILRSTMIAAAPSAACASGLEPATAAPRWRRAYRSGAAARNALTSCANWCGPARSICCLIRYSMNSIILKRWRVM